MHLKTKIKSFAFTLVELLVVMSLLGLIAVVAVSSYHDYVLRSSIASLIPLAAQPKLDVEAAHNQGTIFANGPTETYVASGASDKPIGLNTLVRSTYGCVIIDIDLAAIGLDSGQSLGLGFCPSTTTDPGVVTWSCGYVTGSYASYIEYLPAACQAADTDTITDLSF